MKEEIRNRVILHTDKKCGHLARYPHFCIIFLKDDYLFTFKVKV